MVTGWLESLWSQASAQQIVEEVASSVRHVRTKQFDSTDIEHLTCMNHRDDIAYKRKVDQLKSWEVPGHEFLVFLFTFFQH